MKITVAIQAKNEECNIAECIKSLGGIADEILVLDNGSSDKTVDIAQEYGAIVYCDDSDLEDERRNRLLDLARGEWVVFLDADERISKAFSKNITKFINQAAENIYSYVVPVFNYFGNGKWSYFTTHRIIKNDKRIRYSGGGIHPSIVKSLNAAGLDSSIYPFPIHHLDALQQNRTIAKRKPYIDKFLKQMEIENKSPNYYRLSCFLGVEYTAAGDIDKANILYKNVIENCDQFSLLARLYLINNLINSNDTMSAKNTLLERFPDIEKYHEDNIYKGKFAKMVDYYNISPVFLDRYITCLIKIYDKERRYKEALFWTNVCLGYFPNMAHHLLNKAMLFKILGDNSNMKKCILKAVEHNEWLNNEQIYIENCSVNLYEQQSPFIDESFNKEFIIKILHTID